MTKRASGKFKRNKRDFYRTPESAFLPLLPYIRISTFVEPCAGDGALVDVLREFGFETEDVSDIEPRTPEVKRLDALDITNCAGDCFITNPPWSRPILHKIIAHLSAIAPTWLLIDADWMHTKQSAPYMEYCQTIVSVGRVSWMGNGVSGFDNCAWYLFDQRSRQGFPRFIGRAA